MIIKMEKEKMNRSLVMLLVGAASVAASFAHADAVYDKNMVNCNDRTHECSKRSDLVAEDEVKRPFSTRRDLQKIWRVPALPVPREPVLVAETFSEVSRPVPVTQIVIVQPQDGVKWAYAVRKNAEE
jgi:hypothetical protein